jgi:hypothetical protein
MYSILQGEELDEERYETSQFEQDETGQEKEQKEVE